MPSTTTSQSTPTSTPSSTPTTPPTATLASTRTAPSSPLRSPECWTDPWSPTAPAARDSTPSSTHLTPLTRTPGSWLDTWPDTALPQSRPPSPPSVPGHRQAGPWLPTQGLSRPPPPPPQRGSSPRASLPSTDSRLDSTSTSARNALTVNKEGSQLQYFVEILHFRLTKNA